MHQQVEEMQSNSPKRGMPKGKISAVYEHYEMTPAGKGKCRHCGTEFACPQAANLKKHLRSVHRAAFDTVEAHDEAIKVQRKFPHNPRPTASITYSPLDPERVPPKYTSMPYSIQPAPRKPPPKQHKPEFDLDEYLRTTFGHLGDQAAANGNGTNGNDANDEHSSGESVIVEDDIPQPNRNGNALIAELAELSAATSFKNTPVPVDRSNARIDALQKVVEQQAQYIADVDARLAHIENAFRMIARGLPRS